ncbi:DUF2934 domain-containing protein [Endobacter medicaginis]|nr:DUF2934 domain-containing protein [Endobacter medicaginis]
MVPTDNPVNRAALHRPGNPCRTFEARPPMARKAKTPANPLEDSPARDNRIRERAYHLWDEEGRPHGRDVEFWERATALIGMEDSAGSGQLPATGPSPTETVIEEASIQENLGEFPAQLTDQGDVTPTPKPRRAKAAAAEAPPPASTKSATADKAAAKTPAKKPVKAPAGKS